MSRSPRNVVLTTVFAISLAVPLACQGEVSLEGLSCPCAAGYQCCADNVCSHDCSEDDHDPQITNPNPLDSDIEVITTTEHAMCIAADASSVFWMNEDGTVAGGTWIAPSESSYGAASIARSRTNPPPQFSKAGCGMVRTSAGLLVTATDSNAVYLISVRYAQGDAGTSTTPIIGETMTSVGTFQQPISIVTDGGNLYYVLGQNGAVEGFSLPNPETSDGGADAGPDAGPPTQPFPVAQGGVPKSGLVFGSQNLYWFDDRGLERAPALENSTKTTLVPGIGRDLHYFSGRVYWIANGNTIIALDDLGGPAKTLETGLAASVAQLSIDAISGDGTQLLLSRNGFIDSLPFDGGHEDHVFAISGDHTAEGDAAGEGYDNDGYTSSQQPLLSSLLFHTQRYIWSSTKRASVGVTPDPDPVTSISLRPSVRQ